MGRIVPEADRKSSDDGKLESSYSFGTGVVENQEKPGGHVSWVALVC